MYVPTPYVEDRPEILLEAVREVSFGTLITIGGEGIQISHIPFLPVRLETGEIVLLGHLARANPQWRGLDPGFEAVASFVVDNAYISPSWYPTKTETGKVVPTWNYIAVEARGRVEIVDDSPELLSILNDLTARHEAGCPQPWSAADAPRDYIETLLLGIVGIRLHVREMQGAWKLDQKKSPADRTGAASGLANDPKTEGMARRMFAGSVRATPR
jgi:transcriptional regulator